MKSTVIVTLAAICSAILFCMADAAPGSTRVIWSGPKCTGEVHSRDFGLEVGCVNVGERASRKVTCDNTTGLTTAYYGRQNCPDNYDWHLKTVNSVKSCGKIGGDKAMAFFCGENHQSTLSSAPIPAPVPGDGKIMLSSTEQYCFPNACPKNTPLKRYKISCAGWTPWGNSYTILYPGLTIGKCFMRIDDQGRPISNMEAIFKDNQITVYEYQSGCHGGKNAFASTTLPYSTCVDQDNGGGSSIEVIWGPP